MNRIDQKRKRVRISFSQLLRSQKGTSFLLVAIFTVFGLLLKLPTETAVAQTDPPSNPQFTHLSTADGLPNNTVRTIYQDSLGFMWFGTEEGLTRFDGHTFVTYKQDRNNRNSLTNDQVWDIYEDSQGHLWIGTRSGISQFDPATETFTNYLHNPNDPNSISSNYIQSIVQDNKGYFWFSGPPEVGLNQYDPETETLTRYRTDIELPGGGIVDMVTDEMGDVWLASERGLIQGSGDDFQLYPLPQDDRRLAAIIRDSAGQLWLGGADGMYAFDLATQQLVSVADSPTHINALLEDQNGQFWVGTRDGLYSFNPRTQTWQLFAQHNLLFGNSLSQNEILSLFEDAEGNIWIGTSEHGLNLFTPRNLQFSHERHDPFAEQSIGEGSVLGMTGVGERLWLGTEAVLNLWENGRFAQYPLPNENGHITAIAPSKEGGVWVGTERAELYYFDPSTSQFSLYELPAVEIVRPRGPVPTPITSIYEDDNGDVWLAVLRDGLYKIDPESEEYLYFSAQRTPSNQPSDDPTTIRSIFVKTIAPTTDGKFWLAYEGPGLSLYNPQTGQFTHYQTEIRMGAAEAIYPAPDGLIWVATKLGLARFDPQTETAVLYTEADGLPVSNSVSILPDRQGNLWVGTHNGLAKFDPETETFQAYGVSDGLMESSFSESTAWQGIDGRFYFGSSEGLTSFYPEQISDNPTAPAVVLTELRLFNEAVPIGTDTLLPQSIAYSDQLTLNPEDDIISFEIAALSYADADKNRYRYRLEGLEEKWNDVDSRRRFATYTNLDAGEYVLHVQGSNEDGVWSDPEAVLYLTVLPYWWETLWFRSLVVVGLAFLIYGAFRWRVLAIERRNRLLEAEVARQTAVIQESEKQKQQMAVLEERQRIGRELHDDLGQVLGYVSIQSQAALVQLNQNETVETEAILERLTQVAQDAHADVRRTILGIRSGEERPSTPFLPTLKEYLQNVNTLYGLQTQLSLPPDWEDDTLVSEIFNEDVQIELLRIIQESLNNVRKHAGTNQANILFTEHTDVIQMIIADDGKGFVSDKINEESLDPSPQPPAPDLQPHHFGLAIMRERAEKVGGSLHVRSTLGAGTQVVARVPKRAEVTSEETLDGLRILLVDDHQLYLEGLQNLLRTRNIEVVGLAKNGLQAQEMAEKWQPSLILMDVEMPVCDGLEATRQIKRRWPEIKIVMLTVAADEEKLLTALRYGASGYLLKSVDGTQFFQMLTDAVRGETVLAPSLATKILADFAQSPLTSLDDEPKTTTSTLPPDTAVTLTFRQREVLQLVVQGLTNPEIASELNLTERTVKHHVGQILHRYQLKSRYELIYRHESAQEDNEAK